MTAREWTAEDAARLAGTYTRRRERLPPHVSTPGGLYVLGVVALPRYRPCWRCGAAKDFCHGCGRRP